MNARDMPRAVMITAGGTGGHVFPALAVAESLRGRGIRVVWLGTHRGLEARVVPPTGISMAWLDIVGLRGKGWWTRLMLPLRMIRACWQAGVALRRHRPAAVLAMGGFVTGPGGLMAWLMRTPLLVHEQNAVAGLTNRLLAPLARCLMEAFPGSFGRHAGAIMRRYRVRCVGNPVRTDIASLPEPAARWTDRAGPLRVLVLGGSQGAQALNEAVPRALALIPEDRRPQVRHQVGERHRESTEAVYRAEGVTAERVPFLEDMAEAYGWADLVVCRSGALTVAELAAAGVGSVLVPYPYAVDDHQSANARYLTGAGAAVLLPEAALAPARLASLIDGLGQDRQQLLAMAQAARSRAFPEATRDVTEACVRVLDERGAKGADCAQGGRR